MAAFRLPEVKEVDESERCATAMRKLAQAQARLGTRFDASKYATASVEDIENLADVFIENEIFARRPVKQDNPRGLDFGVFDPYNPASYTKCV